MDTKRQKKILQVITKSNFGGAQKYVYEISSNLKERGYETVVALGGAGILRDKLEAGGIRTIKINSLSRDVDLFSDLKVFWELIKIILKEKPEVIHLNSSKIGGIGSFAARICFVPKIVFTIHGLAFNENRGYFSKIIIKNIYWFIIAMSHQSIAVSKNVRDQLIHIPFFGLIKHKIKIIHNAVRPINFYNKDEARKYIENKIGQNLSGKKIIGTIAELHHIKGINYLIDASKIIVEKNHELIFVVFGEGEEKNVLEKQILEAGLKEKFFLVGFIDNAPRYLKGFDLFVLPSLSEGLALVLLEAKQADLKIVATKVGGIPEAVEDYHESILSEPKNPKDLAEKITFILKADLKFTKNKPRREDNFDYMIDKTIEIYNI